MRLLLAISTCAASALDTHGGTMISAGSSTSKCLSNRFADPALNAFFETAEQRRATRYLKSAQQWLNEYNRAIEIEERQDGAVEDSFVYGWLASQHMFAALVVGKNSTAIMATGNLHAQQTTGDLQNSDNNLYNTNGNGQRPRGKEQLSTCNKQPVREILTRTPTSGFVCAV